MSNLFSQTNLPAARGTADVVSNIGVENVGGGPTRAPLPAGPQVRAGQYAGVTGAGTVWKLGQPQPPVLPNSLVGFHQFPYTPQQVSQRYARENPTQVPRIASTQVRTWEEDPRWPQMQQRIAIGTQRAMAEEQRQPRRAALEEMEVTGQAPGGLTAAAQQQALQALQRAAIAPGRTNPFYAPEYQRAPGVGAGEAPNPFEEIGGALTAPEGGFGGPTITAGRNTRMAGAYGGGQNYASSNVYGNRRNSQLGLGGYGSQRRNSIGLNYDNIAQQPGRGLYDDMSGYGQSRRNSGISSQRQIAGNGTRRVSGGYSQSQTGYGSGRRQSRGYGTSRRTSGRYGYQPMTDDFDNGAMW